ncbi:hypothetical protein [Aliivibrio finisterrensis]|uniref:Uncharacterized protein n=1 Tax=Aliivibrio finisterrensis TaxID=511998 RepID=A0A6N6RQ59_9GAMM|nr:hypothetical protein [Aliivibrio finisterrensis]KAB2823591.1 hypothetical protein F8B77_15030 [Aliivibrio finisterrensis]
MQELKIAKDNMKYNFEKDVLDWSVNTITRLGHRAKAENDPLPSLAQVFTITRHLITPTSRNVKVAKGFVCPKDYIEGYNQIISEIKKGKDLSPRGSRQQNNVDVHVDGMLIDWGVHHLHLGTQFIEKGKNKGLIKGNKEILFVFFTYDCAYIIGVYDHRSWVREDVLLTVKNNWPNLIEPYRINRAIDLSRDVTESDRQLLRSNNINSPVKINRSIYFGPGGGISSGGLGINEIESANIVLRAINDLNKWFNENTPELKNQLSKYYHDIGNVTFIFEVSKYILSRTFTVKSKDGILRVHIPSTDKPASLIHGSIANVIEPDENKYAFDSSILDQLVLEVCHQS